MSHWIDGGAALAGMCPQRLEQITPAVLRHVGPGRLAGAQLLLWRKGRLIYRLNTGAAADDRGALPDNALFRIYSMTKPLTCALAMRLWERGCIRMDDPVARYLPAFSRAAVLEPDGSGGERRVSARRPMTVHDLLTHQSGLSYHFHEYGAVEAGYRQSPASAHAPLEQFVAELARHPLAFHPGSRFRYGYSHDVLAALLQAAMNQPFETLLSEQLLQPLGMHDTGFAVESERRHRLAPMYGAGSFMNPATTRSQLVQAALRGENQALTSEWDLPEQRDTPVVRGGHGLVSTPTDYLRFCCMLLAQGSANGERLLSRKTVELMTQNHLPAASLPFEISGEPRPGYGYGLGLRVMLDVAASRLAGSPGEYGWSGVASTYFWIDPVEQLIGIQMAQFQPSGVHPIERDFRTLAYAAIDD